MAVMSDQPQDPEPTRRTASTSDPESITSLIRSLAETEDALRTCPTRRADGSANPDRRRLLRVQRTICLHLHDTQPMLPWWALGH
jgi:hypothetical protein